MKSNPELIHHLRDRGVLKSPAIEQALAAVDRKNFVPSRSAHNAYLDHALPLVAGQTISQPTTVVIMLELLEVEPGQIILDIGAGSGWVSCLLGYLTGPKGKVYAYEINEQVAELGKPNVENNETYHNIEYSCADAATTWKQNAPFDRIHAGAAFQTIPQDLLDQLAVNGILVAPTQDYYMRKITRQEEDHFQEDSMYGFTFVPFLKK